MTYRESAVRPLPTGTPDVGPSRRPQQRSSEKVIAFSAAQASGVRPVSDARRSRRMRRAALERKLLVRCPQYLSVALLVVFFYLRLALFADAPFAALHLLWLSAYVLAGVSLWNTRRLKRRYGARRTDEGRSPQRMGRANERIS